MREKDLKLTSRKRRNKGKRVIAVTGHGGLGDNMEGNWGRRVRKKRRLDSITPTAKKTRKRVNDAKIEWVRYATERKGTTTMECSAERKLNRREDNIAYGKIGIEGMFRRSNVYPSR